MSVCVQGQEFPNRSSDFIMTAMSYSKSNWPEIRAVAATFIGMAHRLVFEFAIDGLNKWIVF